MPHGPLVAVPAAPRCGLAGEIVVTAGFDVGAERPARPTIAQLREVTQPPSVRTRAGAEHWVAHAYLRDISPYLTRILLRGRVQRQRRHLADDHRCGRCCGGHGLARRLSARFSR